MLTLIHKIVYTCRNNFSSFSIFLTWYWNTRFLYVYLYSELNDEVALSFWNWFCKYFPSLYHKVPCIALKFLLNFSSLKWSSTPSCESTKSLPFYAVCFVSAAQRTYLGTHAHQAQVLQGAPDHHFDFVNQNSWWLGQ